MYERRAYRSKLYFVWLKILWTPGYLFAFLFEKQWQGRSGRGRCREYCHGLICSQVPAAARAWAGLEAEAENSLVPVCVAEAQFLEPPCCRLRLLSWKLQSGSGLRRCEMQRLNAAAQVFLNRNCFILKALNLFYCSQATWQAFVYFCFYFCFICFCFCFYNFLFPHVVFYNRFHISL